MSTFDCLKVYKPDPITCYRKIFYEKQVGRSISASNKKINSQFLNTIRHSIMFSNLKVSPNRKKNIKIQSINLSLLSESKKDAYTLTHH